MPTEAISRIDIAVFRVILCRILLATLLSGAAVRHCFEYGDDRMVAIAITVLGRSNRGQPAATR
jgi:hypothetical protein